MKLGTLILEFYGELKTKESIEVIKNTLHPLLNSVCNQYDFDYKRFEYFAATLIWVVPLNLFWKNDRIYSTLKKSIILNFDNWNFSIYLLIHKTGG